MAPAITAPASGGMNGARTAKPDMATTGVEANMMKMPTASDSRVATGALTASAPAVSSAARTVAPNIHGNPASRSERPSISCASAWAWDSTPGLSASSVKTSKGVRWRSVPLRSTPIKTYLSLITSSVIRLLNLALRRGAKSTPSAVGE